MSGHSGRLAHARRQPMLARHAGQDQAFGGGAGGCMTQSGGFSGAPARWCRMTSRCTVAWGLNTAITDALHFAKQAAVAGHEAFDDVSQHGLTAGSASAFLPVASIIYNI